MIQPFLWCGTFGFNICVTFTTLNCDRIVTTFIWAADKVNSGLQTGSDAECNVSKEDGPPAASTPRRAWMVVEESKDL